MRPILICITHRKGEAPPERGVTLIQAVPGSEGRDRAEEPIRFPGDLPKRVTTTVRHEVVP